MDLALKDLAALALDCQTTGPNAVRDALLEIGWVPVGPGVADGGIDPFACLVTLPKGVELPTRVAKLTGIQESDLQTARSPEQVWACLLAAAGRSATPVEPAGVVLIHYARFERPFLRRLHSCCGAGRPFPLRIVCTHAIARRLLPHLPRCGLRALAGYFGLTVNNLKRAARHARATRFIWEHLMPLLAAKGIREWSTLMAWLETAAPSRRVPKNYPMPRALRLDVPDRPGVYRMRRSNGDLLYLGKSSSLKRRINSYFQTRRGHGEHILEMLTQARTLDYTLTPTALEAALLEADLIKQCTPPYNIMLQAPGMDPVFCTADFQTTGNPKRPARSVGPLPSDRAVRAFGFLVAQCGQTEPVLPAAPEDLAACFDIPVRRLPSVSMLADGLARYRNTYGHPGNLPLTGRRLLRRGCALWRLFRDREAAMDARDGPAVGDAGDAKDWTAADVYAMLDGIVRRGAHLVRRGRWFLILANATLCWDAGSQHLPPARTLVFQNGRPRPPLDASGSDYQRTPSAAASRTACRPIFTAATYDRLRVLTTELRRLVASERRVHIRPAVGGSINSKGLKRLLHLL